MQRAKEIITGFKAEPHSRSLKAFTSTTAVGSRKVRPSVCICSKDVTLTEQTSDSVLLVKRTHTRTQELYINN